MERRGGGGFGDGGGSGIGAVSHSAAASHLGAGTRAHKKGGSQRSLAARSGRGRAAVPGIRLAPRCAAPIFLLRVADHDGRRRRGAP